MNIVIHPSKAEGELRAIPSKSYMHRALICAALADKPTALYCPESNRDIQATVECLVALGAEIKENGGVYTVCPISWEREGTAHLDCHESGSTLRFLLPLVAALGRSAYLHTSGRLTQRPLSPLYEELVRHGAKLSPAGVTPLSVEGQLEGGVYRLDGGISSQFFTGLLLSLPLLSAESIVEVGGVLESAPYVALTCDVMKKFGVAPLVTPEKMLISPAAFRSPGNLEIEGDWSNAAFWLTAGVLGGEIRLTGLQKNSAQGDKAILSLLRQMGGEILEEEGVYIAKASKLHGIEIDARDIPDLVPVLAVAAACAQGETVIRGAARLRLKESDRIESVCKMLTALGISCRETEDGMVIMGGEMKGGTVDACNDHRIAMSAAVASVACPLPITLLGAEAVNKSYPAFFRHFALLGGKANEI
ncbi:MAG: 3-phosphoshikimate 1-carboxyvinyltransferase [Clostridia bacterium]|nr:3-phosphoshikimate 1-carboxyvinyltransferase [Clostridia bacterium]